MFNKISNIVMKLAKVITELVSERQKLGQTWNARENTFIMRETTLELDIKNMPERQILSLVAPLFDPIALINFVLISNLRFSLVD